MKRFVRGIAVSLVALAVAVAVAFAATYPTGVATFPTRVTGTVIQPAWFNDLGAEITAIEDALVNGIDHEVLVTLGTITTDKSNFEGTATWNAGGVTFRAIKANVTDTASDAASLLMDLQVGGASRFKVGKDGSLTASFKVVAQQFEGTAITYTSDLNVLSLIPTWNNAGVAFTGIRLSVTDTASSVASLLMDLQVGGASKFKVDKSGKTIATNSFVSNTDPVGPITSSTPGLDATQTWNAGGVTFTGIKLSITDTASAAASLLMDLQVGGASKFKVSKAGLLTLADGIDMTPAGTIAIGTTTASSMFFKTNATLSWGINTSGVFFPNADNVYDFGADGNRVRDVYLYRGWFKEIADPSAPAANEVRLYAKDNGSGKTQLCARFNTGAVQCFATEP